MQRTSALVSVCFCAGLIAALFNSAAVWLGGSWGIASLFGVTLAPAFTTTWLYPRLIWGGLWGALFCFWVRYPYQRRRWIRKGMWFSLLPSAAQLFIVFPKFTAQGMLGLGLGTLTPFFILFYNLIWGLFLGVFTRLLWGRG